MHIKKQNNEFIITLPFSEMQESRFFTQLQFLLLTEKWKEEVKFLSFAKEMTKLPSYQAIIEMGEAALPFIFQEMQQQPTHWFAALKAITKTNPILAEHKGDLQAMTNDWLIWAKEKEII